MNKKRHIGNDIVCVVFLDNTGAVFNPSWIRSHFIHAYIVVQHITGSHGQPLYRVSYHGNHLMWLDYIHVHVTSSIVQLLYIYINRLQLTKSQNVLIKGVLVIFIVN